MNDLVSIVYDVGNLVFNKCENKLMNAVITKVSPQNQSVDVCTLSSKMPNKGISLSVDQIKFFSRSFQQGQGISKQSIQVASVFLNS